MTDHDAEMDALLDQLEAAGLVEVYVNEDGRNAMRLTPAGEQVSRQLAMTDDAGQGDLMAALLEAAEAQEEARPSRDGLLVRAAGARTHRREGRAVVVLPSHR